jgi:hypothetical protein
VDGNIDICSADTTLLVSDGDPANAHQWFLDTAEIDGATGTSYRVMETGTYYVMVTNPGGCSSMSAGQSVTVTDTPPVPVISTAGFEMTTSSPYSLGWYVDGLGIPGATDSVHTAIQDGDYTVIATNGMCSTESLPQTIVGSDPSCDNPTNVIITHNSPTSIDYNFDLEPDANLTQIQYKIHPSYGGGGLGTVVASAGSTSKTINGLQPATLYQSRIRHQCGVVLGRSGFKFKTFMTNGVRLADFQNMISLFPNPVNNELALKYQSNADDNIRVSIYDLVGKTIITEEVLTQRGSNEFKFDVSGFSEGMYIAEIKSEYQKQAQKFLISR